MTYKVMMIRQWKKNCSVWMKTPTLWDGISLRAFNQNKTKSHKKWKMKMNKKKRTKSSINITKVLWIVSTRSNTFLMCFKGAIVELIWVWSEMICKKSSASWYWMLHPNSIRTPMTIEKLHAFSLFRVIKWTLNLLIWFILEFKQFFYKWCKIVKEFSLKNRNGKIKLSMSVLWRFNLRFLLNGFILVVFYNVTLFRLRIELFFSIMTSLLISFLS